MTTPTEDTCALCGQLAPCLYPHGAPVCTDCRPPLPVGPGDAHRRALVAERARLATYVDRCYVDSLTLLEAYERGAERMMVIDEELDR